MRSFNDPNKLVKIVMSVTLVILFGVKTDKSWTTAKKRLGDSNPSFLQRMKDFKGEDIKDKKTYLHGKIYSQS
jgi:hypothetical protein